MNKFGDLTSEEFKQRYLVTINTKQTNKLYQSASPTIHDDDDIDWRLKDAVTSVKNEMQCGACWAFSAATSIEGAWAIATGSLNSLSTQQLLDCSSSYGNAGCNGGMIDPTFQYVIDNGGIDTDDDYPYKGVTNFNCRFKNETIGASISMFLDIESGNEGVLQEVVMRYGPVSGAIDATRSSFQFYQSGVYYDASCSSNQLSHGINVVGFGTTDKGEQYYIVKNMWGTNWGMGGYVLMARNRDNNCGIATTASFPLI